MDGMTESEPTLSSACCAGPARNRPIGQFWVIGRILNRKFNVPIKAGHGPSHSTDFNWPRLLPPTGPSQSSQEFHHSCIESIKGHQNVFANNFAHKSYSAAHGSIVLNSSRRIQ